MRAIELYEGQFTDTEFYLFSQWPFIDEEGPHIGFILEDEDSRIEAIAYAWNLYSVDEIETAPWVEIALIEVHPDLRGEGLGTQLMTEIEEKYEVVTVYGVENSGFFTKLGYSLNEERSLVNENDHVWTK